MSVKDSCYRAASSCPDGPLVVSKVLCVLSIKTDPVFPTVPAGRSAVLRWPALQLQPTVTGGPPAETSLLWERPQKGPPEADPHDDRRPFWPQWTHCGWGRPNQEFSSKSIDAVTCASTMYCGQAVALSLGELRCLPIFRWKLFLPCSCSCANCFQHDKGQRSECIQTVNRMHSLLNALCCRELSLTSR